MILTKCAACAAPLAHDHKARCSRCKTRYCNEACQRQHWETARGLPPDWTEEDLRRQGHDLDATREEDESPSDEGDGEDGSGYPGETEDRGDGRGVAAAMLAQMADAGVEVPAGLASMYGLS